MAPGQPVLKVTRKGFSSPSLLSLSHLAPKLPHHPSDHGLRGQVNPGTKVTLLRATMTEEVM